MPRTYPDFRPQATRTASAAGRNLLLATALTTAAVLPLALPVLPAADVGWTYKVVHSNGETIGWPSSSRPSTRSGCPCRSPSAAAVIFTSNYGEAGAINELGRADGLPTAVSGHNSEWWWGPGNPRATTVVAVGGAGYDGYLAEFFSSVQPVATLSNPAGIHNQEWGGRVYLCTGPISPWAQLWPQLRHYD